MNKTPLIGTEGNREWAVLPYAVFRKLVQDAEAARDLAAYRDAKAEDDGFRISASLWSASSRASLR